MKRKVPMERERNGAKRRKTQSRVERGKVGGRKRSLLSLELESVMVESDIIERRLVAQCRQLVV